MGFHPIWRGFALETIGLFIMFSVPATDAMHSVFTQINAQLAPDLVNGLHFEWPTFLLFQATLNIYRFFQKPPPLLLLLLLSPDAPVSIYPLWRIDWPMPSSLTPFSPRYFFSKLPSNYTLSCNFPFSKSIISGYHCNAKRIYFCKNNLGVIK